MLPGTLLSRATNHKQRFTHDPMGLPGRELQKDPLKDREDDLDSRGEKARRNPSNSSVAVLVSVSPPGRVSSTAIRVPGNRANPAMKLIRVPKATYFHRPA